MRYFSDAKYIYRKTTNSKNVEKLKATKTTHMSFSALLLRDCSLRNLTKL